MDFQRSADDEARFEATLRFAREQLDHDVVEHDREGRFPREAWRRAAAHGVLGWPVPKRLGGSELPVTTVAYLMEALGEGCRDNGLCFALGAQMWGVLTALLHFGSEEQCERWVPGLIDGSLLAAYGMTEAGSGSDAFGLSTTARRDGDHFVLDGVKELITFAPIADVAIVFAVTDPEAGRWGLSAFLVETSVPGVEAHPVEDKMGLRTVPFGRMSFEGCRVPASALLGPLGAGASLFSFSQGWERSLVLAPQLGAMQRLLDECVAFARERKRAGLPIGKHQAVSHRIADMKLRLELSRLSLYKTAWLQQDGKPNLMEAALTKIYLSEAFTAVGLDAIAIHGGDGYKSSVQIERNVRDAIGGTIYGGTVDIQRNIVAGLLGL